MPATALNSVGVVEDMPPFSQIAKGKARTKFHNLLGDKSPAPFHNAKMAKDKIPNRLRAWREFRKMTQEELAEKADTSVSQISMLESGDRGMSHKWLLRLAPILNTTPGHLLDHDPAELDNDVFDIWVSIDKRDRAQALRVLKSFQSGTNG
jgi:transcriptional regulator with XRE-family HTH domain